MLLLNKTNKLFLRSLANNSRKIDSKLPLKLKCKKYEAYSQNFIQIYTYLYVYCYNFQKYCTFLQETASSSQIISHAIEIIFSVGSVNAYIVFQFNKF